MLVGEGEDREVIEKGIALLGLDDVVTLTGNREDVGCLLKAMDIYTQPSAWEGICFALLEAMSAGLPCVATNLPVFREWSATWISRSFRLTTTRGLAAAISHYVDDTDRALESGRAGADRWAEAYTVERMASAHESVYRGRVSQH